MLSIPLLIRHVWQLKTAVFLHRRLMHSVLLHCKKVFFLIQASLIVNGIVFIIEGTSEKVAKFLYTCFNIKLDKLPKIVIFILKL